MGHDAVAMIENIELTGFLVGTRYPRMWLHDDGSLLFRAVRALNMPVLGRFNLVQGVRFDGAHL